MPFCYSPWSNIDISPVGEITPCCKFQKQYYEQQFNIQTHSLDDYAGSKLIKDIKQEFQQDIWPIGCERCRIEESNGIESKRQLDYARWKDHYDSYDLTNSKFITTSVAFGNTCNLKCITCGPYASSRWQKEYYDLYGKDIPHFKFYKKNFVQDFISQAPDIVHLDIPGGEPFLSGVNEQKALLSHYVNTGQAKNITLHYTTNAQIFPDTEWWQLWAPFKEIDIQLSIDGVGARYEYIRHPASWEILVANVTAYQQVQTSNIKLSVSHTVSAYNVYYLDEFFKWCYTMGLPRPWLGRVHTPKYMRPEIWPEIAHQAIVNHLNTSTNPDVLTWATLMSTTTESEFFDEFKSKLQMHDQYRNTDFNITFPELTKYL
jgi:sulfatase maturation enzyme AslB (radical SAM superfamily)